MAQRTSPPPAARRAGQIRWAAWADGHWWELQRGPDHDKPPRQALQAARMWAKRQDPPMWVDAQLPDPEDTYAVWKIRFQYRERGDAARVRDSRAAEQASVTEQPDPG